MSLRALLATAALSAACLVTTPNNAYLDLMLYRHKLRRSRETDHELGIG